MTTTVMSTRATTGPTIQTTLALSESPLMWDMSGRSSLPGSGTGGGPRTGVMSRERGSENGLLVYRLWGKRRTHSGSYKTKILVTYTTHFITLKSQPISVHQFKKFPDQRQKLCNFTFLVYAIPFNQ